MATYPSDQEIDATFPDNNEGLIDADAMRVFQKEISAAGKDYTAITTNAPISGYDPASAYVVGDQVWSGNYRWVCVINDPTPDPTPNFTRWTPFSIEAHQLMIERGVQCQDTAAGEPVVGMFTVNDPDGANVTQMRIGLDYYPKTTYALGGIVKGDFIDIITGIDGSGNLQFHEFQVDGINAYFDDTEIDMQCFQWDNSGGVNFVPGTFYMLRWRPQLIGRIPPDGSSGQILGKLGNLSYNTEWIANTAQGTTFDPSALLNLFTSTVQSAFGEIDSGCIFPHNNSRSYQLGNQVTFNGDIYKCILAHSPAEFDLTNFAPITVPAGGTTGQVLVKASNSDYDVMWGTV